MYIAWQLDGSYWKATMSDWMRDRLIAGVVLRQQYVTKSST